jgi:DNA helicase-2/ATP-dependent DNA helicase PcrA
MAGDKVRRYQLNKPTGVCFSIDYEKELNSEQLQVVMAPLKPLLVLAGAGSGKTRALVYRLARMIELGLSPGEIRLLTFTNRAAKSMLERAARLCGALAQDVVGGTFHSVALKDLQRFAETLGYTPHFTVIGRDDVKELMNIIKGEAAIPDAVDHLPSAEIMLELISLSLNTLTPIDQVILNRHPRFYELSDEIGVLARRFFERKRAMNVMDFDDMLVNWYTLLREHDEVAAQLQSEIKAVLVDEYQDTNNLQCEIVRMLAKGSENVTVVGDDAQSIYAFRGASVRNILEFQQVYSGATALQLLTNYRSTPQIVKLANESRKCATEGFKKELLAHKILGESPAVVACRDVNMQANFVAQRIQEMHGDGVALDEIAILYRAHHHAMELQLELMRRQIPFVVRSGLKFFEQAHIKDVLAYLKYAYNVKDEISFRRAVRLHDGVGPLIAQKLWQVASVGGDIAHVNLGAKAKLGVVTFLSVMTALTSSITKGSRAGTLVSEVLRAFYESYAMSQFTNGQQRCEDIKQLATYANSFASMDKFLSELMLLSEFGVEELPSETGEREKVRKVTLSSVHQSKGLEWSHVFVVWLAEGRFPSELALREPNGVEEERRLFYVAATRAKETLHLVHPNIARHSDWRQIMLRRSRFVEEITSHAENWVVEEQTNHEQQTAHI